VPAAKNPRGKLADLMAATVSDESRRHDWTYAEVRPMPVPPSWKPGDHVRGDCSKGVQFLCRWAGVADPMGEDYGPWGNSQTLWSRLQHLDLPGDLEVGDFVTSGRDGEQHAAMVAEAGDDPLLWSFGRPGAPAFYRLSADRRPAQYLRNPLPGFVSTPADRLRARTGWFAWVAWRLGEGDWRDRGPLSAAVRPDVPKAVPLSWWARYALFLANRKRPDRPKGGKI
jgi:hypothetical protein